MFAEHVHPDEARKNKKEKEQNGYGSSVVAAVNFSRDVCFDFSRNREKCP